MQKLLEVAAGLSIPPNLSEAEIGQILDALGLKIDDTPTTRYWRVERNAAGDIVKREPLTAEEIPMEATSTTNTSSDLITEVPATPQNSVSAISFRMVESHLCPFALLPHLQIVIKFLCCF